MLVIAVDDLNDWVGCLGGHPQAHTPNIDRLAERGTLLANAHCQSPVCNPSRASLMTGLYPETTGIYFLQPSPGQVPVAARQTLLTERFEREGYELIVGGKLMHGRQNYDRFHRLGENYGGSFGGVGPFPERHLSPFTGHKLWDWGVFPDRDEQMPDHKLASWAEQKLAEPRAEPFFMAIGFARPHVPQYAPQEWFDRFPLDEIQLPETLADDLDDVSDYGVDLTRQEHIAPTQAWVERHDQWKPMVQSYLACVAFVDHQVGRVLDALESGGHADDTIVVLFSDHGFHLGEKRRHAKRSIWENGDHVPLIIDVPGLPDGQVTEQPAELIDIYPTLLDLSGLEPDPSLEGDSLRPLLESADAEWTPLARSSYGPGNVAIISESHRYVRYNDGSEELYDRRADPHEWTNLAASDALRETHRATLDRHRAALPTEFAAIQPGQSTGHNAYSATEERRRRRESGEAVPREVR